MEKSRQEFKEELKEFIRKAKTSTPLTEENDLAAITDSVMRFLEYKAKRVETLFDPMSDDGLDAVPLDWTRELG